MEAQSGNYTQGTIFAERYRIEKALGNGGMGEVYLVNDTLFGGEDLIALKLLHPQLCTDEKHSKRFLREVQLTRKVSHPNVIRTFDVGECDGRLYFTMEYVEGVELREYLKGSPLPVGKAATIVTEVCKGLSAIHEAGIIHRDLKPANILVLKNGSIKIADFGVARPGWSDLTGDNEVVGSAPFMAPELWLGEEIDHTVDLYAVGVLFYEMLTGVLPFEADSAVEMMGKHLQTAPTPPSYINPLIPRWSEELTLALLAKAPTSRPTDGLQVCELIEAGISSEGEGGVADESLEENDAEIEPAVDSDSEDLAGIWGDGYSSLGNSAKYAGIKRLSGEQKPLTEIVPVTEEIQEVEESERAYPFLTQLCFWFAAVVLVPATFAVPLRLMLQILSESVGNNGDISLRLLTIGVSLLVVGIGLGFIPVIIALSRRSLGECLGVWIKSSAALFGVLVVLYAFTLFSMGLTPQRMIRGISSNSYVMSAEIAATNFVEIGALIPEGSQYVLEKRGETSIIVKGAYRSMTFSLVFYALWGCYFLFTVRLLDRSVFGVQGFQSWGALSRHVTMGLFPAIILLVLKALSVPLNDASHILDLGLLQISVTHHGILWGATTWGLLWLSMYIGSPKPGQN